MEAEPVPPELLAVGGEANPQSNKMIWLVVGCAVLACCCLLVVAISAAGFLFMNIRSSASTSALPYAGRADDLLKQNALDAIQGYESSKNGCRDVSLLAGQVLVAPDSGSSPWKESWQVLACGASHLYTITFTPSPGGGTDFSIHSDDQ